MAPPSSWSDHRLRGPEYTRQSARQMPAHPTVPASKVKISGATVGERIRAAMVRKGLRQAHLAELVGVTWQTVHNWITDKHPPDEKRLPRLLEVLEMRPEELLGLAAGQEPSFEAWREFIKREGDSITAAERRAMAAFPWPPGRAPTVNSYHSLLAAIRATTKRRD
jgi:transcriptional regulator with XRE-family HTH domain